MPRSALGIHPSANRFHKDVHMTRRHLVDDANLQIIDARNEADDADRVAHPGSSGPQAGDVLRLLGSWRQCLLRANGYAVVAPSLQSGCKVDHLRQVVKEGEPACRELCRQASRRNQDSAAQACRPCHRTCPTTNPRLLVESGLAFEGCEFDKRCLGQKLQGPTRRRRCRTR